MRDFMPEDFGVAFFFSETAEGYETIRASGQLADVGPVDHVEVEPDCQDVLRSCRRSCLSTLHEPAAVARVGQWRSESSM